MKKSKVLLSLAVALLFSVGLNGQSAENMSLLGNWGEGGGEIRAVSNFGDLVYYGVGNVFKIVSFEDPANPYSASSITLDDMVEDIVWTVMDGQTYCFVVGTSLNVIDVTNPMSPSLVTTKELAGYGEGIAISGNYVYVAVGSTGMEVFDISDTANPNSVAVVAGAGSGYAEGINVTAPYAYLANGGNLTIFDVNDPTNPSQVSAYEVDGGWIQDAKSISNYIYVCDWGVGVHVLNVSSITDPSLVTTFSNPVNADVMFDGNFGYIASRQHGLTVIDVSSPEAPTLVGTFATDGVVRKVSFGAINMDGQQKGHVFTAEVSLLGAVNVSDPANMAYSGKVEVLAPAEGIAYSSLIVDNLAYVAYGDFGLRILDVTNPAGITELGNLETAGSARKIVVKDNTALIASRAGGVWVVDVSNPAAPDSLTTLVDETVNDIAMVGNYAYAAARDAGIAVINATTANAPVVESYLDDTYGEGVAAYGDRMAASTWDKIVFFDISNPATPVKGSEVTLATGTGEFTLHENYAYIHDFDTLRIYDMTDVNNILTLGKVYTGGSWDGSAAIEGNFAYANAETNGIRVIDITDKNAPAEVGFYDGTNSARGVSVKDGIVYVAEKEGGLTVYKNELYVTSVEDITQPVTFTLNQNFPNPFNPVTAISYTVPDGAKSVMLTIYNAQGQLVRTLVNGTMAAGAHSVVWDGRIAEGSIAPNGVYLYQLNIDGQSLTRKMAFLK
jgi:hypothetical protein